MTAFGFSDAAKRCSDVINLHVTLGNSTKFAAIRLADGSSDGVAYDTRADAIRHQLHEELCAYVFITPDGMSVGNAERFLRVQRMLYDNGMRLCDPEHEVHVPHATYDALKPHLWTPGRPLR